ncbi:MAG: hypothetical protein A2748_00470 [Candidatus Wildermuthbacteria bacterium RIFCSPHIGHO2_01_FULL_45_20]|uniref:Uncharacterized protein n=1 Tax=Candidatus Wildermuthbacteria bacterium RIFCSPHIGHO2_02_FULL_45_25 TaxID=1802450 RepID=A0A1G2R4A5_9BACT|nr:MAG: hypothetical protein A2748_00470 [Candidatus Wildermuthbacteria bacterium RIFCSPHIGHO2_01_FULL_45_20]OHA67656.1 MAG: hypothetical protein A3C04_01930 [Candidatus Wildermuthbacteria bacterium RIFCSPHIGHO2_02_FULL_45_25]
MFQVSWGFMGGGGQGWEVRQLRAVRFFEGFEPSASSRRGGGYSWGEKRKSFEKGCGLNKGSRWNFQRLPNFSKK